MNITSELIDSIVQQVILRLKNVDENKTSPESSKAVLTIDNQVVTLATIERKLNGVSQVEVKSGAVVTPAVFDLLRERSIAFSRRSANGTKRVRAKIVVATTENDSTIDEVASWLDERSLEFEMLKNKKADYIVRHLSRKHLVGNAKSIVVSKRPFQFGCLANRCEAIRAIVALNASMAKQAVDEMNPNVLIMDANQTCPQIVESFLLESRL